MRITTIILFLLCFVAPTFAQTKLKIEAVTNASFTPFDPTTFDTCGSNVEIEGNTVTYRNGKGGYKTIVRYIPHTYVDAPLGNVSGYLLGAIETRDVGTAPLPRGTFTVSYVVTDGFTRQYVTHTMHYGIEIPAPVLTVKDKPDAVWDGRKNLVFGSSQFTFSSLVALSKDKLTLLQGTLTNSSSLAPAMRTESSERVSFRASTSR